MSDFSLRSKERQAIEDNNSLLSRQLLRYHKWRNGKAIKPMPGDKVLVEGHWNGVLIRRTTPKSNSSRRFLFLKRETGVYRINTRNRRVNVYILEPMTPGSQLPIEVSYSVDKLYQLSKKVEVPQPAYLQYGTEIVQIDVLPKTNLVDALKTNADVLGIWLEDLDLVNTRNNVTRENKRAIRNLLADNPLSPFNDQIKLINEMLSHSALVSNQDIFKNPRYRQISFRNNGKFVHPYSLVESGKIYVANLHTLERPD